MAPKVKIQDVSFEHIKSIDVLFVDLEQLTEGARVTTVDVGETMGFPGQILARIDYEREITLRFDDPERNQLSKKIALEI